MSLPCWVSEKHQHLMMRHYLKEQAIDTNVYLEYGTCTIFSLYKHGNISGSLVMPGMCHLLQGWSL